MFTILIPSFEFLQYTQAHLVCCYLVAPQKVELFKYYYIVSTFGDSISAKGMQHLFQITKYRLLMLHIDEKTY